MVLARPHMGDEVLAYFGYPQAYEHDAERAGLALVEAMPKAKPSPPGPLRVRVGIATGLVVLGDLIGAGAAQELPVVGETPNLSARRRQTDQVRNNRRAFYWLRKLSGEPGHGQGKEMSSP